VAGSKFYRRQPGVGWLVALIAVPLLLAFIGWGASHRSDREVSVAAPTVAPTATLAAPSTTRAVDAGGRFGAMAIVRTGNGFSLTGEVPDEGLKTMLPGSIRQAMPGAAIVDHLTVAPGVKAPDFGGLGGLFGAAVDIRDFSARLVGDTVTLTGTANTPDDKAAAEASAKETWPNALVVNDIQVGGASTPPAPAPAGSCVADLSGLLTTPITFDTNGSTLGSTSQQVLAQIAAKAKGCPDAKLTVTGYTDNTGNDAINVPLSASRAKAVVAVLISDGVAGTDVTSSGAGAAKPVADNDTAAGRAQNRRVEITVG
jgi:peptidoglycan-binding protein ArfA